MVPEPIDEVTDEAWDRIVELNLTGVMRLTRALVPGMKERKWGRIIHISSVLGLGSKPGRNGYSATKARGDWTGEGECTGSGAIWDHG